MPRIRALAAVAIAALCSQLVSADRITVIEAVKSRNIETVAEILKRRVDVNARQADGATALHWAAHFGDVRIAELLIRAGARPGIADDTGVTPIHLACTNRSDALVDMLLEAGADPNATLLNGETALMTCSRTGDVHAVEALVARGADVDRKERFHDQTALMWAAAERHPGVVAALIDRGASVSARSRTYTQTVTSEVTQRAGREELNYTVPRGGMTPLLFAARSGDVESARLLIAGGATVDDALPDGMTALVLAAHSGHQPVGMLLLEQGADPDASGIGYSALHAAILRGGVDLVKALLAHGANPNLRMTRGTPVRRNSEDFELSATLIGATPYFLASRFLETDIMRALAAGGADPHLAMPSGDTPLMAAVGLGASAQADRRGLSVLDGGRLEDEGRVVDAVAAAIAHGADVNAANRSGDTAMHAAALLGYQRVIQQLADAGARLDVKNARGQTALTQLTAGTGARTGGALRAPDRSSRGAPESTIALLRKLGATE